MFTLKTKFLCMYLLYMLLAAMPQEAAAQGISAETAHFEGKGMALSDVVLADNNYKGAEEGDVDPNATRLLLYNKGKDMFVHAGGYWGTRMATFSTGLPLVLSETTSGSGQYYIRGPFYNETNIQGTGSYTGFVYAPDNTNLHGVYFDRNPGYTDDQYCSWQFEEVSGVSTEGDRVYRVYVTRGGTNYYLCANQPMIVNVYQEGNNNLVKALPSSEIENFATNTYTYWKIVSVKEFTDLFETTYNHDVPTDATLLMRAQGFNCMNMYNNSRNRKTKRDIGWKLGDESYGTENLKINYTTDFSQQFYDADGNDLYDVNAVAPNFGMFYCADIKDAVKGERLYQRVTLPHSGWYRIECQGLYNDADGTRQPYANLYAKLTDATAEGTPGWSSVPLLTKSYGEVPSRLGTVHFNSNTFKNLTSKGVNILAGGIDDGIISNKVEAGVVFYTGIYPNSVMIYANFPEGTTSKELELGIEITEDMAEGDYVYVDDFQLKYLGESFALDDDCEDFTLGSDKKTVDYSADYVRRVMILKRDLKEGKWNSLCLPIDLTAQQLRETFSSTVKLAKLSDPISDTYNCIEFRLVNVNPENDNAVVLRAGECYIIKPGEGGNYITEGNVPIRIGDEGNSTIAAPYYVIPRVSLTKSKFATDVLGIGDAVNFKKMAGLSYNADGTFVKGTTYSVNGTECQLKVYATFENDTPTPAGAYNFYEGDLYHFKSDRNRLKGYNWWIEDIHAGETAPAAHTLSFRASMDGISDNTTTAIEGIAMDMDCHAVTPQTAVYNVCGQAVRRGTTSLAGLPAGLYIVNGKKVLVR